MYTQCFRSGLFYKWGVHQCHMLRSGEESRKKAQRKPAPTLGPQSLQASGEVGGQVYQVGGPHTLMGALRQAGRVLSMPSSAAVLCRGPARVSTLYPSFQLCSWDSCTGVNGPWG